MTTINPKQRSIARENILKVLYQKDLNKYSFSEILKTFIEKRAYDKDYFENIILLIEQNNEKEIFQQKLKLNPIKNKLNKLKIYVVFLNPAQLQKYFERLLLKLNLSQ